MAINHYTSVSLTRAVQDLDHAQKTGRILAQFPESDVTLGQQLEYGYDSANPQILHVRKQHEGSSPIAMQTGTLKTVTFPKYRPSTVINEIDARKLDPSLSVYTGRDTDPNANFNAKIAKQLKLMLDKIKMSTYVNAAVGLRTGSVSFKYEDATTATIEYGYGSAGTNVDSIIRTALSGTTAPTAIWTHANATPMNNIELLASCIRKTSGYGGAFDVLMGTEAWNAFKVHSTVTNQLDNRRIESGRIVMNEASEYKASINGFDIYQIDTAYDLGGTWTDAWDSKTIAVIPRDPGDWFSLEFGAPFEIPEGSTTPAFIPVKYFSKIVVEHDPVVQKLILESRPIPLVKNKLCLRVQAVIS